MVEITVLGTIGEFIVGKTSRGIIVINTCGDYKSHSHFKNYSKAIKCIKYINKKQRPADKKLNTAVERLVGKDAESYAIKNKKPRYNNRRR